MISPSAAWDRLRHLEEFKKLRLTDFRAMIFVQEFTLAGSASLAAPTMVGPTPQQFPGGAIILGIAADAFPEGQPQNPFLPGRARFRIQQSYTTNEAIVSALGLASALLGTGKETIYPPKELYLPPNQAILTTLTNLTTTQIRVTVDYHCLVWRFAQ